VDTLKLIAVTIYVFTFCAAGLLGYNSVKNIKSQTRYKQIFHAITLFTCGAIIIFLLLITSDSKIFIFAIKPGFGAHPYLNYNSDISIMILLMFLILFLLFASLYLKEESEIKMKIQSETLNLIQNVLNKNERIVIQELTGVQEMTQAELQRRTGIPKSTLSRTLKNLEQKGLIIRFRSGMSNKVKLKHP